jgi:hypothetical protein
LGRFIKEIGETFSFIVGPPSVAGVG